MTRLQFTIRPPDPRARTAPALPVNIHRAEDFAIVDRSVTGRDLALEPGDYVAVVRFPDGAEVSEPFRLGKEAQTVELKDIALAIAAHAKPDPVDGVTWTSDLPYDFIDFNPFANDIAVLREEKSRAFAVQKEVSGPNGDRWRYLAVAPQGHAVGAPAALPTTFLVALPTPERARVTVTLRLDKHGRPCPSFVMPRVAATLLYRYLSHGAPEAAERLSGSIELSAKELVENKAEDPISGALGLYLLLQSGRFDGIGERSEKLFRYNPRLGDGAIIWAEYLAREGQHGEAAETLMSLSSRGLPTLTIGFRTALSRTSTYIRTGLAKKPLLGIDRILRYWAERSVQSSPTTVLELDPKWAARVRKALTP
jgi:hypothetical protein